MDCETEEGEAEISQRSREILLAQIMISFWVELFDVVGNHEVGFHNVERRSARIVETES